MKSYTVEFVLPCEQPEENVRVTRTQAGYFFDVPTNLPGCAHVGFAELLRLATGIDKSVDEPQGKSVSGKIKRATSKIQGK